MPAAVLRRILSCGKKRVHLLDRPTGNVFATALQADAQVFLYGDVGEDLALLRNVRDA